MIRQLSLRNFKALRNNSIKFRPITVLAGINSAGKSSVIQGLLLCKSAIEQQINQSNASLIKMSVRGDYLRNWGSTNELLNTNADDSTIDISIHTTDGEQTFRYDIDNREDFFNFRPQQSIQWNPALQYLHAERMGPRPYYEKSVNDDFFVGYKGEFAVAVLAKHGYTYNIDAHRRMPELDEENKKLRNNAIAWLNSIVPNTNLDTVNYPGSLVNVSYNNSFSAPNVGFGVSYVLPIIVAGLVAPADSLLIIENPEAHLHPSGQTRIGEFLAQVAGSGVQIIIETHSEHIVDGIHLGALKNLVPQDKIVFNFFRTQNQNVDIQPIFINHKGELSDFPRGFFDQAQQNIAQIIRLRRNTPTLT